ncbi:MAG: SpoIIE family protein phosphatase [Verrucomicrobiota bacterium]
MSRPIAQERKVVDWGVAAQPIAGEAVCGDMHLVKPFNHGVLLAAIDGIGHGSAATDAAQAAVAVLEEFASDSVVSLVKRCHQALIKTRGVALTVASLSTRDNTVTWLGVGNVTGLLLRADDASHSTKNVLLRSGMVGYHLPALHASVMPVAPGDLLIFATDGIRSDFATTINLHEAPQSLAQRILQRHFKGTDDALVLVVRYLGTQHE